MKLNIKYKLVLFDLDGTLLNTLPAINKIVNETMKYFNLEQYSMEDTSKLIGNGVVGLVDKIYELGDCSENIVSKKEFAKVTREYYNKYYDYDVYLYKDVDKLLDFLQNNEVKMGIVTNKDHKLAIETVNKLLNKWTFCDIYGADDEKYKRKPDPVNVFKIIEKENLSTDETVYIGDMLVDVNTAKNASIDLIYCNWGYGKLKGGIGVDESNTINSVEEIINKMIVK